MATGQNTAWRLAGSGLPPIEKCSDGAGVHVTHIFELASLLRIEQLALRIEHRECGDSFFDGNPIFLRHIEVAIHLTDVDRDDDEILCQESGVGFLAKVDIEHLTISAPVSTEVEDDALVLGTGFLEGGSDIGGRVRGF